MTAFNSESSISHSFSHTKFIPIEILNQIEIVDFQFGPDLNDVQINTMYLHRLFQLLFCQNSIHILE